jgi:hypothetical protein
MSLALSLFLLLSYLHIFLPPHEYYCCSFSSDGLRMLVDILGPPPSAVIKHEMARWKHIIDPVYAMQLQKEAEEERRKAVKEKEEHAQKHVQQDAAAAMADPGSSSNASPMGAESSPPSSPKAAAAGSLPTVKSAR